MTRTLIASAIPADNLHGDESQGVYSAEEEAFLDHRTAELLAERLNDRQMFRDLLGGIEPDEIDGPLHRALCNLDRAIGGEDIGKIAIYTALTHIQRRVRAEAETMWAEECRREAERQLGADDC